MLEGGAGQGRGRRLLKVERDKQVITRRLSPWHLRNQKKRNGGDRMKHRGSRGFSVWNVYSQAKVTHRQENKRANHSRLERHTGDLNQSSPHKMVKAVRRGHGGSSRR
jgi:hypothetical protein